MRQIEPPMFSTGQSYRRRDLHARYGGQGQSGISTPSQYPIIFLFTKEGSIYDDEWNRDGTLEGEAGSLYDDGWNPDGTFRYSGQGQRGDMTFTRGNRAIRDHAHDGKELHLFAMEGHGDVRYLDRMVYVRHDLVPARPDAVGDPRTTISFVLARHGSAA